MTLLLALLLACRGGGGDPLPAGDPARPDIVLVSIDTLRADHLSSYGYGRETSPFLDSLAAAGARFAHARSASPWTLPAHTTMLTGQLPATHRVIEDSLSVDPAAPFLPDLLRQAGYATGGFVATLYVSRKFGFDRGFDEFEDFGIDSEKENLRGETTAADVIDAALAWWRRQEPGKPIFLFVHVYDVHYTYDPPDPYATLFDRAPEDGDTRYKNYFHHRKKPLAKPQMDHQIAQYDEAIRYVDDQLKRIATAASSRAVRWLVTSDHGEEFGERGSWGHAHTLYAEQLRIPLILSGPGIPAGKVVEGWVGNHDIAPTLAGWAGVAGLKPDGIDLAPALAGTALPERAFLAETTRFSTNRLSLLEGALRLEWDLKTGRRELFDPLADPAESRDLAGERPGDVAALSARAITLLGADWEAAVPGQVSTEFALLRGDQRAKTLDLTPGDRFLALPYDAPVAFAAPGGAPAGPWQAVGGAAPAEGAPLKLLRVSGSAGVEMDAATRERLEALGYIQEGQEEE